MDALCQACVFFFVCIMCSGQEAVQTCLELEFLGGHREKTMTVKEDSVLNLTFHLTVSNCNYNVNWSLVKVTTYENDIHVDICKVIIRNKTCLLTESTLLCTCLHEGFIQFYKRVTQEDSKIYILKWSDSQSHVENQREITLFVMPSSRDSRVLINTIVYCISVIVIIFFLATLVSRRLLKAREINESVFSEPCHGLPITSDIQGQDIATSHLTYDIYDHIISV